MILVVNDSADCGKSYGLPFVKFGKCTSSLKVLESPEDIKLAVFCGGSDVSPALYGEAKSARCGSTNVSRDLEEAYINNYCRLHEIPMVGICRGGQFLCAMSGGSLHQHVDGHTHGRHMIEVFGTIPKREIEVNSIHHQAMKDLSYDAVLLAQSAKDGVYEAAYFPKTKALSVQWHPEIMSEGSPGVTIVSKWLAEYFELVPE